MMRKRTKVTPETDEPELRLSEPERLGKEVCSNPWNGKCTNTDIALYIMFKGNRLPICRRCWEVISSNDIEWMYD